MKVSVITTVWNVAEWLDKNIQSFLNQTLKDIELILVNDCSPDNSADIIHKYNDSRIKVINNEKNVGPGVSRQIGIDNSCGEYTIFVDGDDWLENDCLEVMYTEAIKQSADIVSCKVYQHSDYGLYSPFKNQQITEDFYNFINNKLIKREIWTKTPYSPLRFREDINTLFRCLEFSKNTIKLEYAGYHYNLRPNSLTSTPENRNGKSYLYITLAIIENLKFVEESGLKVSDVFKKEFCRGRAIMCYHLANVFLGKNIDKYQEECKLIDDYFNETQNEIFKTIFPKTVQ